MSKLRFARVSLSIECERCRAEIGIGRVGGRVACARCRHEHEVPTAAFSTLGPLLDEIAASGGPLDKKAYGVACSAERVEVRCDRCGGELVAEATVIRCSKCDETPGFAPATGVPRLLGARLAEPLPPKPTPAWKAATVRGEGLARAVTCPTCGASLPKPDADQHLLTCTFCKTLCQLDVPGSSEEPAPVLLFAFAGPTPRAERAQRRAATKARPVRERAGEPKEPRSSRPDRAEPGEARGLILGIAVAVAVACSYLLISGGH